MCSEASIEYMRYSGRVEVTCSNGELEESDDHETDLGVVCTEPTNGINIACGTKQ